MKAAWALALLLCLATSVEAGRSRIGTTGAPFLKIGVSPRAAALADAYGALGDDVGAIYSNPAGLALIERQEAMFVHAQLVADLKLNSLFYALPLPDPWGRLAINYLRLDYGDIERTILNAPGAATPFARAGTFTAKDQALSIGYAGDFTLWNRFFRWGVTAKVIQQKIDRDRAGGLAYDLGVLYVPPGERWRYGVTLQNVGFLTKFRDESDPLPLNLRLSAGGWLWRDWVLGGVDVNVPIDNTVIVQAGLEVRPVRSLALRAGYRYDDNTSDFKGITAGAGFRFGGIAIDYAYVPFEVLGVNHRFSVDVRWGATRPVDLDMIDDDLYAARFGRAPAPAVEAEVKAEEPPAPRRGWSLPWPFGRRRPAEPAPAEPAPAGPPPAKPAPAGPGVKPVIKRVAEPVVVEPAPVAPPPPVAGYRPPRQVGPAEVLTEDDVRGRAAWADGYTAGIVGRHAEAAEHLYRAAALLPDEPDVWASLVHAVRSAGREAEAASIEAYVRGRWGR